MKITADTNVLIRALVDDDRGQAETARQLLSRAASVAIPVAALCEMGWVLRKVYGFATPDIAHAISTLLETRNVVVDRVIVERGLAALQRGGDFADGAIAAAGAELGAEMFASFDRKACAILRAEGFQAADPTTLLELPS